MDHPGSFHVAVFGIDGELSAQGDWQMSQLNAKWLELARGMLRSHGEVFRAAVNVPNLTHIEVQLTSSNGCALGSFWADGELTASTAYFSGRHPAGEAMLQQMFVGSMRRIELVRQAAASSAPFGALSSVTRRPLHVVVPWGTQRVPDRDHQVVAELANHFAGGFFFPEGQSVV